MPQKQIDILLPDKLGLIFDGPADYRGAYGGRGAAKTIGFANMAIAHIMQPSAKPWKFLCCRELQKSLKDSVFGVIAAQIGALGVSDAFDVGREFIRCKNGNEFLFYGLRTNIAEVKGLHGVRRTWIEEAQKVSQSSLTYLVPTVMRDFPDCEIWASWNPDDEDDPIHKMFVTDADENFRVCKVNWYDNPWFPESLNKVRLRDKKNNPGAYDWIWEGNFNSNAEGSVYGKWLNAMDNAGRIKEGIYDPELPVYTAWDLGFSDDTAIWWFQIAGLEIRLIDYYENNREDIKHYIEQLYGREIIVDQYGDHGKILKWSLGPAIEGIERRQGYKYAKHFVPHDAANKLLQAGGRSIIQQGKEMGVLMHVVPATSQQNQIQAARTTLDKCWADPVLCKDGLRALRKYAFLYDEDRAKWSDKPDHSGYSHGADAFEIIAQVWKSAIMTEEKKKPRFLEDLTANEVFFPETPAQRGYERI